MLFPAVTKLDMLLPGMKRDSLRRAGFPGTWRIRLVSAELG